jgi:hypothetical protein
MEAVVVAFDWDLGGDLKLEAIAHGERGRLGLVE